MVEMKTTGRRKVGKLKEPVHVFEHEVKWRTVISPEEAAAVHRVLGDPIRLLISNILDEGRIQQINLCARVNKETKRKYDVASILHHLDIMRGAGIINYAYEDSPRSKIKKKMVFKIKDVRLQTKRAGGETE